MQRAQGLAVDAVTAVLAGRSLTAVLEGAGSEQALAPAERAALVDIAHGTLRHLGLLRALVARMLRKPPHPPRLGVLLYVALYQLAFTKTAPYAIVDEAVKAAVAAGWPWARGMVNAVLRRFLRESDALLAQARATDEGRFSYPPWWIERIRRTYPPCWQALLDAGNARAPMTLRVNQRRNTVSEYQALLRAAGIAARPLGASGLVLERPVPVAQLPGFRDGLVSVQDGAAQLAAEMLDLAPGQQVLDAFAAPGGKSAHILEHAAVRLTALDVDANRLERLRQNLSRLGLQARVHRADAGDPRSWWDGQPFDRVLADLPCTGSGVVRRHPDIKWLRREADIAALAAQASALLDALWRVLRPGGKLLLATCSVFREENRDQVDAFVGRHADAALVPLPGQDGLDVQLLPDENHDGFYYALLQRAPSPAAGAADSPR
jgi:16S rRNA (cytosine967-C5)-methyltransferase